jgi:hypothetical protein
VRSSLMLGERDFYECDPAEWSTENRVPAPSLSFLDDIVVSRATREDWKILEALHYKNHGTTTPGSHYYKMTLHGVTEAASQGAACDVSNS